MRPALLVAVAVFIVALAGCSTPTPPVGGPAPDVTVQTASGPLRLAETLGRQVVLQFAPADSVEAWAALAAASADLAAEGALVIGVSTDGLPPESPFQTATDEGGKAASAFGYTGVPLAVVIDRQGLLRGITAPRQADDLFALAAPVLLEGDAVDRLVRNGAALIDLRDAETRASEGAVPYALICPLGHLAADVLPADIGAQIVLLGPDAEEAAAQAAGWGYSNVLVVADASELATGGPVPRAREAPARVARPSPRAGVRG